MIKNIIFVLDLFEKIKKNESKKSLVIFGIILFILFLINKNFID